MTFEEPLPVGRNLLLNYMHSRCLDTWSVSQVNRNVSSRSFTTYTVSSVNHVLLLLFGLFRYLLKSLHMFLDIKAFTSYIFNASNSHYFLRFTQVKLFVIEVELELKSMLFSIVSFRNSNSGNRFNL